jgi:signal transduction histidine kinase
MICPSYPDPQFFIITQEIPQLIYYSHIPAIILSLLFGFFVFLEDRRELLNKALLFLSLTFSFWVFFDLIQWTNNDSNIIFFTWSLMGILSVLILVACFYLAYLFIYKKDFNFLYKIVIFFLTVPVFFFTPTSYNLKGFNLTLCGIPGELTGKMFDNYTKIFSIIIFLSIIALGIVGQIKKNRNEKIKIIYFTLGIEFFIFAFFTADFIAGYLVDKGITKDFNLGQYGLFGMPIFIGFLAYLIVKFKAFNVKLIGAQALVYSLIILIGSQFFFIQSNTNRILTGITLLLAIIFGFYLIRSVKNEVKRKEELQEMTDKLAIANDQLRKLDNAKSEFISIASHQLRTPLTAIKGFVSLLLEGSYGKIDIRINEVLEKVYTANERLIQLVEDLLNVSRIESGRLEYKFEKSKIEDTLKELEDDFSLAAKERKLYLNFNLPEKTIPEIEMDKTKIREVVSNLIDNALKYTKRGGVTVKLEGDQEKMRVTVSDTGIGIPKEELPYLFSKFSRGKDVSRLHVGGTGLGLYVGKSMVEAHHGKIWAESDGAEMGSRFIVELPVVQPRA